MCVYKTVSYNLCIFFSGCDKSRIDVLQLHGVFNNVSRMVVYSITRYLYLQSDSRQMILDLLVWIRNFMDRIVSFRSSCCEGVCGSCSMLINNMNTLACIQPIWLLNSYVVIYSLPHFNIIRDIVIDLKHFYEQYTYINPFYNILDSSGFTDTLRSMSLFRFVPEAILAFNSNIWESELMYSTSNEISYR